MSPTPAIPVEVGPIRLNPDQHIASKRTVTIKRIDGAICYVRTNNGRPIQISAHDLSFWPIVPRRRRALTGSAATGACPVSLRLSVGSPDALRLDRLAARYGGRSAALRAGLLALEACAAALDIGPDPTTEPAP